MILFHKICSRLNKPIPSTTSQKEGIIRDWFWPTQHSKEVLEAVTLVIRFFPFPRMQRLIPQLQLVFHPRPERYIFMRILSRSDQIEMINHQKKRIKSPQNTITSQ